MKKQFTAVLLIGCALLLSACAYVVLPEGIDEEPISESAGWMGLATNVGAGENGSLRIDLTIRNDTGDWSAMQAVPGKPVQLQTAEGQTTDCESVFVCTGGHRLAPGFQMRGYTAGTKSELQTQLIYVECDAAEAGSGSVLVIDYSYVVGEYDYYEQDATKTDATMTVSLDDLRTDLEYPVGVPVDELVMGRDAEITALNDALVSLAGVERTETGLLFTWNVSNPSNYPGFIHLGNPPVIGSDGILYGFYESPDIASVPVVPAGGSVQWTTEVTVPPDVTGLYILTSVESKKQRLFVSYALDITDL
jgi:hypothetical protein